MIQRTFAAAILTLGVMAAAPAWAFHCPADMAKIDAKLAENPTLTSEQMAEVKKLRAEGEALHEAGKHAESVAVLGQAMTILGIQ